MDMTASRFTGLDRVKLRLRAWLLKAGGIKRIHIVGCARSGTTMLHYSMIAFANTLLIDQEVAVVGTPSLKESGFLCLNHILRRAPAHMITKREYAWFHPEQLDRLIDCTLRERIGIINIVRDPRDVLTSQLAGEHTRRYYVEPERWMASIQAGDDLFARLETYPHKLTVRYEDVVTDPATAKDALASKVALTLRPNIDSIGRLKDNLEKLDASTRLAKFMRNIRNFDPATIGRWRTDPQKVAYLEGVLTKSEIQGELQQFMDRYNYPASS
jgi:hypothetical protein